MNNNYKFIHLLYVPTMACNMECKYCYLEENTKDEKTKYRPIDTLKYAINKFIDEGVIPFNISLHGGEVTTLSKEDFRELIKFISNYYRENEEIIKNAGFKIGAPHIKTNLYGLDKHIDTIKEFEISISGSLDLPLSLHDKFRVTKGGKTTLNKILENVRLLSGLPNKKKVSATIFKEHYELIDNIISDIKFLDKNTCLDMNDFNFMIGFDYNSNGLLTPLSEEEQVAFFNKMHEEFDGTNLDKGVNGAWFNEFGPDYCTNCDNCGEKFFLLEKSGEIYSCVRGQKNKDFYYGNIYNDSVKQILENAYQKIFLAHNKVLFDDKCSSCGYLYLCKTGCPFVKNVYNSSKSYTCMLQQELYKKRNYLVDNSKESTYLYVSKMHPSIMDRYIPDSCGESNNSLESIIKADPRLKYIYDSNCFILSVDGEEYYLSSQILKKTREIIHIGKDSEIYIYVKDNLLEEESLYPENNSLYIMLLSGDLIKYGDEGRIKQKHIMSHQIYKNVLEACESDKEGYFKYDISGLIREYSKYLSYDAPNNLFFTTTDLRNYHYLKQKNNAYYHIEAINLPFQNIEFFYVREEDYV